MLVVLLILKSNTARARDTERAMSPARTKGIYKERHVRSGENASFYITDMPDMPCDRFGLC